MMCIWYIHCSVLYIIFIGQWHLKTISVLLVWDYFSPLYLLYFNTSWLKHRWVCKVWSVYNSLWNILHLLSQEKNKQGIQDKQLSNTIQLLILLFLKCRSNLDQTDFRLHTIIIIMNYYVALTLFPYRKNTKQEPEVKPLLCLFLLNMIKSDGRKTYQKLVSSQFSENTKWKMKI